MVHNLADITPAGTPTALSSTHTRCNWIAISPKTANSADMRIGDNTTSATSGILVPKGTTFIMPPISDDNYLDLALIFVYGASSDSAGVIYGTH